MLVHYKWQSVAVCWAISLFLLEAQAQAQLDSNVGVKEDTQQETAVSMTEGNGTKTRVVILTSGLAEFTSYWLEDSANLAVKFKTPRIESKIAEEIEVDQGIIKKISSRYVERNGKKFLASLNFELTQQVPYEILQEKDRILIELQAPLNAQGFSAVEETFGEASQDNPAVWERLAAMDTALFQAAVSRSLPGEMLSGTEEASLPLTGIEEFKAAQEAAPVTVISSQTIPFHTNKESSVQDAVDSGGKDVSPSKSPVPSNRVNLVLAGLNLIMGIALAAGWIKQQKLVDRTKQLKLRLQEKENNRTHENILRKAVEEASLQREKEYQHLKEVLAENEQILLQKESECEKLRETSTQNTLPKIEIPAGENRITDQPKECRSSVRLDLNRDYSKTIILRMKFSQRGNYLKCFAANIGLNGLCFETKENFQEKEPLGLRLIFYGETVPIMKIQAHIVWKRERNALNYYGIIFNWVEEENREYVKRYIESKIKA